MTTLRRDGRWMARQQLNGTRVCGYGATPEEAEADLQAKLIPLTGLSGPKPITLHDLAKDVWYPHIDTLAPLSRKRYEGVYVNHIRKSLGGMNLDSITPIVIRQWLNGLTDETDYTKHYALGVLKSILMHATKMEIIVRNPCTLVSVPRRYQKRERILEIEDALKLLAAVKDTKISAPVFLAATLSLRRSEIAGLKWEDLDKKKGELRVVRQRQAIRPHGIVERELKTSESRRTLYLPDSLAEEIESRGDRTSAYITTYAGSPWVPDTITEFWADEREALGLPDWHFHDLRHLAAGLLASAGCDLLVIAAVLGHKRPDMSLLYTSVAQSRRREGADLLGKLFAKK